MLLALRLLPCLRLPLLAWLVIAPAARAPAQDRSEPPLAAPAPAEDAVQAGGEAQGRERAAAKKTFVIPLEGMIEPNLRGFVERKFEEAQEAGAELIVLEIDSPGGRLDTTFEIVSLLRDAEDVETMAYIRRNAHSGAAMIALACDRIEMHPEAQIGDVGVIIGGPFSPFQYVEEKQRSPVVAAIRSLADATGRPAALAEAMVDKDVIVYSLTHIDDGRQRYVTEKEWESMEEKDEWRRGPPVFESREGNFLTVSGSRAVELGLAEATSRGLEETLDRANAARPVIRLERTWVDRTVDLLNSGWIAALLILIGLIALGFELSAPGLGLGGLVSALCFALFFWSRFLGGTAGWLEVVLFIAALAFLAAEVFVFPGFGVAGLAGIGLLVFSLVMASRRVLMPQSGQDWFDLGTTVLAVCAALLGAIVAAFLAADSLSTLPLFRRLVLEPPARPEPGRPLPAGDSDAGEASESWGIGNKKETAVMLPAWQRIGIGDLGHSVSPLRPSGKAQFAEDIVDVSTEGEYIAANVAVRVIKKQGMRLTVRSA